MNVLMKKNVIPFFVLVFFCTPILFPQVVFAASVTNFQVYLSRLIRNTAANQTVYFVVPSGISAGSTTTFTWSADFTGMGAFDWKDVDFAIGDSNDCTTATFTEAELDSASSGDTWGVEVAGQSIFIHSDTGAVDSDRCVRFYFGTNASYGSTGDSQITNGSEDDDDTLTVSIAGGDSGTAYVDIITNDQVVVTAIVQPSFTFAISDNTIEFGNLSAGDDTFADDSGGNATETQAHTLSASTNAASGYVITMNGTTLTDGAKSIDAIGSSNTATSVGSEQFGVRFIASGGSGAVSAPYAAAGFAFDTAAFPDEVAASTVSTATTTYSARYIANIAANTEAGSYTTTLTYVATGRFYVD
jgi:hypothetical protein